MHVVSSPNSAAAELLKHVAAYPPGTPFSLTSPAGKVVLVGTRLDQPHASDPNVLGRAGGVQLKDALLPSLQALGATPPDSKDVVARLKALAAEARKLNLDQAPQTLTHRGIDFPVYDSITFGRAANPGAAMPAQNKTPAPGGAAKAPEPKTGLAKLATDPKRATALVNCVSTGAEAIAKLSPGLEGSLATVGTVMDGFAVLTNGAGIYTAWQKKDKTALAGYTLSFGISALGVFGAATGNPTLRSAALVLKIVNTGVTTYATVTAE
jgi:hypothetical protein